MVLSVESKKTSLTPRKTRTPAVASVSRRPTNVPPLQLYIRVRFDAAINANGRR